MKNQGQADGQQRCKQMSKKRKCPLRPQRGIPLRRDLAHPRPWGHEESDMTEQLHFHALEKEMATHSCLENPRDSGAWWAAVYGVAQSPTRLKWLNSNSSSSRPLQVSRAAGPSAGLEARCPQSSRPRKLLPTSCPKSSLQGKAATAGRPGRVRNVKPTGGL